MRSCRCVAATAGKFVFSYRKDASGKTDRPSAIVAVASTIIFPVLLRCIHPPLRPQAKID